MAPPLKQPVGVVTLPNRGVVPTYAADWTTHVWVEGADGLTQKAVTLAYVEMPSKGPRNLRWVDTATGSAMADLHHLGIKSAQEAAAFFERRRRRITRN